MKALDFIKDIIKNEGITVADMKKVSYNEGYQVAINKESEITSKNLNELLLLIDILEIKDFGIWLDAGIWYLDKNSRYIKDYKEAVKVARANDQKAIFDWSTFESIEV